jgi:hypothetical protein
VNEDRSTARAIFQGLVFLAVVVLQDPEIRRNAIWAAQWTGERLRAMLRPDDDEPPAPEVSRVLQAAREITEGN